MKKIFFLIIVILLFNSVIKDYTIGLFKVPNQKLEISSNYLTNEINELKKLLDLNNNDYELINATVISRNTQDFFKEVTIDKGTNDGIKEDMAVITKDGLIGKTIKVTKKTSMVKLITSDDIYNKISVSINNETGIIDSYSENEFTITGITSFNNIKENDLVTTTGLSYIYPGGINIGRVTRIIKDNFDLAYIVKVEPLPNFNNFRYVAVVKKWLFIF